MAISKLPNRKYQARVISLDGRVLTQVFETRRAAQEKVSFWKHEKLNGTIGRVADNSLTVSEFFQEWFQDISGESAKELQSGWRAQQEQYFRTYINPVIGNMRLRLVTPQMIKRVLINMTTLGKSPQTQRLVFATMKKMFGDAVENYQYLGANPVLRKLKPATVLMEAKHLNLLQVKKLLQYSEHRTYGLAIWIQIYLGLRMGELVALRWEDVDLDVGRIHIRRTYVTQTGLFRDYPKGGRHHSHSIPIELLKRLIAAKPLATSELVVNSVTGNQLNYRSYVTHLKLYCSELGIPVLSTHGLRHSTSELYIHHGATRDDLRRLFAHSTPAVTDRYVHDRGTNLEKIANVLRLFPASHDHEMTTTKQFEFFEFLDLRCKLLK